MRNGPVLALMGHQEIKRRSGDGASRVLRVSHLSLCYSARLPGLEPGTDGLEIRCSILLSYRRVGIREGEKVGWMMGVEPTTTGTTIQRSAN